MPSGAGSLSGNHDAGLATAAQQRGRLWMIHDAAWQRTRAMRRGRSPHCLSGCLARYAAFLAGQGAGIPRKPPQGSAPERFDRPEKRCRVTCSLNLPPRAKRCFAACPQGKRRPPAPISPHCRDGIFTRLGRVGGAVCHLLPNHTKNCDVSAGNRNRNLKSH